LIHNPAWQQKPSTGFLEGFDVIVYTGATDFTGELAQLVTKKENPALAHAAYLTLDRMVLQQPEAVLRQLQGASDLMRGREQTRANYFARADVRDAKQRALLEEYLLDPRRTLEELQTFAGIYPSGNFMISNNLLTKNNTPTHDELAAHDREALAVVNKWGNDPRFERVKPQLEQIRTRLTTFVGQEQSGQ
jgi:hypothetical protein